MLFRNRVGVRPLWCFAVLPHATSALPVPYLSNGVTVGRYIPLIVISLCVFLVVIVFLGIKLLYMKHRRIGTIHSPHILHSSPIDFSSDFHSSTTLMSSGPGVRVKYGVSYRGLLVGCFGSPRWETRLRPKLDQEAWQRQQRASFMYQLHRGSRGRSSRSSCANPKPKNPSSSSRRIKSTSFFSFSSEASIDEEPVTAVSFLPLRLPTFPGDNPRKPSQQNRSSWHCVSDFGEPTRTRKLPEAYDSRIKRRTSQSSVRLVDGPSSGRVSYSFLSRLPPQSTLSSPFMGTRDSLQLSRHSSRYSRKPVSPLPPLPSYRPLILKRNPHHPAIDPIPAGEYLPPLQFSPPTSITSVFHSQQQSLDEKVSNTRGTRTNKSERLTSPDLPSAERILDSSPSDSVRTHGVTTTELPTGPFVIQRAPLVFAVQKMNRKPKHKRSRSRNGPGAGASPLRLALIPDNTVPAPPVLEDNTSDKENSQSGMATVLRTPSASSHSKSTALKKPLKSSLRQGSVMASHSVCSPDSAISARFTVTPSMSETSTQASSKNMGKCTDDQASLRTPVSEVDIGMLGLDRFHWNDESEELRMRPSHMKKDSRALISFWEEGGWIREQEQHTDMGVI